jgi:hypothetical protein
VKRCKHCGVEKPLDEFYGDAKARDGRRPECKACNLARRKERYRANPRPHIERARRWQRENPERYRANQRAYAASGRKKLADRKSHLKRTYGLTLEAYDEMLAAQGGGCAICGDPGRDDVALHVDHDPATGAVRGLLCFRCNNALGDLRDSYDLCLRAAAYVDRDEELCTLARRRALALAG